MAEEQVKRRLLTILAADVAGYSRMVAEDEEGTVRQLAECQREFARCIAAHDGRLVKTAGDSALAAFDSPVEAVRCAVEMQRWMAARNARRRAETRLRFRIGINIGDVVVRDGDILGDGVNVASRLENLAEPGGICISGAAYDLVAGKVDLEVDDLGEKQLRNIPRGVRVYALPSYEQPEPEAAPAEQAGPRLDFPRDGESHDLRAPLRDDGGVRRRRVPVLGISIAMAAAIAGLALYFVLARTGSLPSPVPGPRQEAVAPPQSQSQPGAQQTMQPPPPTAGPRASGIPVPAAAPAAPPPSAQPTVRPFVPDQVPFVTDAVRERLRTEYVPARDHKAVVISRRGASAWFQQGQLSEEEAARHARASCAQNAPEPCELYALGNRVVWDRPAPPMPPPPYLPPPAERVLTRFDLDRVPLVGPAMREALRADYLQDAPVKAVAIARSGTIGFAKRRASEADAVRAALEYCGDTTGTPCAVLALDDNFVQPIPGSARVTGLFEPERDPLFDEAARQKLRDAYLKRGGWKAVAVGLDGVVGASVARPSERDAVDQAVADCRSTGGKDCALYAIGIFTVQGK